MDRWCSRQHRLGGARSARGSLSGIAAECRRRSQRQPHCHPTFQGRAGEHDAGIDLVAKERDGGLCAIQCKFYSEDRYIARGDIDTFLADSGRGPFTSRMFVSTTERWSTNAEKVLANQHVPVQRIGVAELAASPFDWSRFDPAHPDQLSRHTPKSVRPHQEEAITDVLGGFETV
ncbi:MAG: restriction endonuclease, partial [Actinobacteria bacterium]|nr:restriction endonuclease [Actinomycetota bacterium]